MDCSVRLDETAVPPICKGAVMLVVNVGVVPNTSAPEPVSSVTAAARLALDGVPRKVATPVPRDVMPVPPLAAASVPPRVNVPVVVIGPPVSVSPVVPPEPLTEVTLPLPLLLKVVQSVLVR